MNGIRKFNKVFSIFTVAFFLTAQPTLAAPSSLMEELKDDDTSQGFIDADQAQQAHQRQLNEVDRMQSTFEDGNPTDSQPQSVLSKFQNSEEENLDSDLALSPTPIAENDSKGHTLQFLFKYVHI